MFPPHLPPPACSISQHQLGQRLKIILAAAAFGLLAGLTGASIMLGWLWPRYGEGDLWANTYLKTASGKNQLAEKLQRDLTDQMLTVYRKESQQSGVNYLNDKDKLGSAVVISSDGWLVMGKTRGDAFYGSWRVLGKGGVYRVEKALPDNYANVLYLKIVRRELASPAAAGSEEHFKVMTFAESTGKLEEVFVLDGENWQSGLVANIKAGFTFGAHLDGAPVTAYVLEKNYTPGAMVVDTNGHLVGILTTANTVLPVKYLTRVWPNVLSGGKVIYQTLGVEGWFSAESPVLIKGARAEGFLVSRILNSKTLLRRGDVITEINGLPATPDNFWAALGNKEVRLKIWRSDKQQEFGALVLEQK